MTYLDPRTAGRPLSCGLIDEKAKPSARFQVGNRSGRNKSRAGLLKLGTRAIRTPAIWFGTSPGDIPKLWDHLRESNSILSAAAWTESTRRAGRLSVAKSQWIEPERPTALLMDSGGFRFLRDPRLSLRPASVMATFREVKPDLGVVLDFPLDPGNPGWANRRRWLRTLGNTRWMFNHDGTVNLMPVVHGYTRADVESACSDLASLPSPAAVGLGSLVPLMKRGFVRKSLKAEWASVREYLEFSIGCVRSWFPNSMVHIFGLGSLNTVRQAIEAGADSVDSSSWRFKAAHGAILVPGGFDRFVTPGPGRAGLSTDDREALSSCKCPVCNGHSTRRRMRLLDNSYSSTFTNRGIHNAHVLTEEVLRLRRQVN